MHNNSLYFLSLLFLLSLLLIPNAGIITHDASLYLLQSLARLEPKIYLKEPFFHGIDQDSFTVFSLIYSKGIKLLGINTTNSILLIITRVLYLVTFFYLCYYFTKNHITTFITTIVMFFSFLNYGNNIEFIVSERFLTARSFAEPFALMAIYFSFIGRIKRGFSLFLLSSIFHPIMALPCLIYLLSIHLSVRKTLIIGLSGIILIVATLSNIDITFFSDRLSSEWLEVIKTRSPFLFLDYFSLRNISTFVFFLSVNIYFSLTNHVNLKFKKLAKINLLVMGFIIITMLVQENSTLAIITQIQSWRWVWLVQIFSVLLLTSYFFDNINKIKSSHFFGLPLICFFLTRDELGYYSLAFVLLSLLLEKIKLTPSLFITRSYFYSTAILTLALSYFNFALSNRIEINFIETSYIYKKTLSILFILLFISLALESFLYKKSRWYIFAALLPLGLLSWLKNTDYQKWESDPSPLKNFIPDGALVYNHVALINPAFSWFQLQQPQYFSFHGAAGVVFSKEGSAIFEKRRQHLVDSGIPATLDWDFLEENKNNYQLFTNNLQSVNISFLCNDPDLDFALIPYFDIKNQNSIIVSYKLNLTNTNFLYSCELIKYNE